ncbi:hypothetical protein [Tissierella praeacuta]|uniref:Uncharacterized protein n=1 Tax=Tissierella praeacuta DSM 18095 TaxID=1123404 RepID=A0A1M4Z459_9FIRM|nr:hypothetical protein [Tissierella praeacuta]MBU5257405.1 hypothetical protein [Tissierella praeacuta]SHF12800.1 hypothetical protein SAMN02745784_02906 [Tissierella praeacuta DSM 18095]SUP00655.1 Uncharacterised protein [Tissierella praeacuta]
MDIIKDFMMINKQVFKKTLNSLKNNGVIIFTGIVYMILNIAIFSVVLTIFKGILSIFAGIILAIVSASLISNYLYLLYNIINYNRITFQDFKDGFKYFLRKVYTVFFFAWIGSYLLSIIQQILGFNAYILNTIITISIFFILNALPETLYLKVLEPMDSIMYSIDFIKDNWFNWLLPNILFYGLLYYLTGNIITDLFATHLSFGFNFGIPSIIKYLLGQGLFSFIMIYRGHLFKLLSTSTRRKRMFMNKF